jgi:hypothetical protein
LGMNYGLVWFGFLSGVFFLFVQSLGRHVP